MYDLGYFRVFIIRVSGVSGAREDSGSAGSTDSAPKKTHVLIICRDVLPHGTVKISHNPCIVSQTLVY